MRSGLPRWQAPSLLVLFHVVEQHPIGVVHRWESLHIPLSEVGLAVSDVKVESVAAAADIDLVRDLFSAFPTLAPAPAFPDNADGNTIRILPAKVRQGPVPVGAHFLAQ